MKNLIILSAVLLASISASAEVPSDTYRYVVQFHSQCCGVPSASPLINCITSFKKKNKIKKVTYYLISPMGKEGEYYMAFQLTELSKKQVALFIKQVDATAIKMKDKGSATTEQNMAVNKESLSSRTTTTKKTI